MMTILTCVRWYLIVLIVLICISLTIAMMSIFSWAYLEDIS